MKQVFLTILGAFKTKVDDFDLEKKDNRVKSKE